MLNKYTTVIVGDVIDLDMGSFQEVVQALDPFQVYARHVGSSFPWVAFLELDLGAPPQCRSGEDTQLFQFEACRPSL